MKPPPILRKNRAPRGFVSYTLVISTAAILSLLMITAFRRAVTAQEVAAEIQLRNDYIEKEDAVIRAMITMVPNRAIRAMQANSATTNTEQLTWNRMYNEALDFADARKSIAPYLAEKLALPANVVRSNSGDANLDTITNIFRAAGTETGTLSTGLNRSLGTKYPVPLNCANSTIAGRDATYPIISDKKIYGALAAGKVGLSVASHPKYNLIPYPNINFGYTTPGSLFVAKRNWWAFSMNLAAHDAELTRIAHRKRDFVISLYEIPSQLAISAASFLKLGEFSSGETWAQWDETTQKGIKIDGGVFASRADVANDTSLDALASRRGISLSATSTIGNQQFIQNPFAPGIRENYHLTQGAFFPVSMTSESGRAAFIPISRNEQFFDRYDDACKDETNTLTDPENNSADGTTWNNYTIGARQTAMRLDIIDAVSTQEFGIGKIPPNPNKFRFSYMKNGKRAASVELSIPAPTEVKDLPPGFTYVREENQSYDFGNTRVDLAYGLPGQKLYLINGITGPVTYNNATFGDPVYGSLKKGYYRLSAPEPWSIKVLSGSKPVVSFCPEKLPAYLNAIKADPVSVNHSVSINVDYTTLTGSIRLKKPGSAPTENNYDDDYAVLLEECANLSPFVKGFSLVTNLRLHIGDDFNTTDVPPPADYPPPKPDATAEEKKFYPPCSLFAPEKRFGSSVDPRAVNLRGRLGSLSKENDATASHPLDSRTSSGQLLNAQNVKMNLSPMKHPADLPPVTMMNWLVVAEEIRPEFSGN